MGNPDNDVARGLNGITCGLFFLVLSQLAVGYVDLFALPEPTTASACLE